MITKNRKKFKVTSDMVVAVALALTMFGAYVLIYLGGSSCVL